MHNKQKKNYTRKEYLNEGKQYANLDIDYGGP